MGLEKDGRREKRGGRREREREREREGGGGKGADRERSLSIADEFNGVAFRCIPVELAARGPSKSIRENLFGTVHAAAPLPPLSHAASTIALVEIAGCSRAIRAILETGRPLFLDQLAHT